MAAQRDEATQILRFGGVAVGILMVVACLLGVFIPFRVNLKAVFHDSTGTTLHTTLYGQEREIAEGRRLELAPGEMIFVNANNQVEIEILNNLDAFAYIQGPANWRLETAWRRATVLGHVFDNAETHTLVIEQNLGTTLYDFSRSKVPLQELNLTLRFSDQEFQPNWDCFQATAGQGDLPSSVVSVPCADPDPAETPIPTEEPTAPPLP